MKAPSFLGFSFISASECGSISIVRGKGVVTNRRGALNCRICDFKGTCGGCDTIGSTKGSGMAKEAQGNGFMRDVLDCVFDIYNLDADYVGPFKDDDATIGMKTSGGVFEVNLNMRGVSVFASSNHVDSFVVEFKNLEDGTPQGAARQFFETFTKYQRKETSGEKPTAAGAGELHDLYGFGDGDHYGKAAANVTEQDVFDAYDKFERWHTDAVNTVGEHGECVRANTDGGTFTVILDERGVTVIRGNGRLVEQITESGDWSRTFDETYTKYKEIESPLPSLTASSKTAERFLVSGDEVIAAWDYVRANHPHARHQYGAFVTLETDNGCYAVVLDNWGIKVFDLKAGGTVIEHVTDGWGREYTLGWGAVLETVFGRYRDLELKKEFPKDASKKTSATEEFMGIFNKIMSANVCLPHIEDESGEHPVIWASVIGAYSPPRKFYVMTDGDHVVVRDSDNFDMINYQANSLDVALATPSTAADEFCALFDAYAKYEEANGNSSLFL